MSSVLQKWRELVDSIVQSPSSSSTEESHEIPQLPAAMLAYIQLSGQLKQRFQKGDSGLSIVNDDKEAKETDSFHNNNNNTPRTKTRDELYETSGLIVDWKQYDEQQAEGSTPIAHALDLPHGPTMKMRKYCKNAWTREALH